MSDIEKNNIYYEITILSQTVAQIWTYIKQSELIFPLFVNLPREIQADTEGEFFLKRLFFPLKGQYHIESYAENKHFFANISLNSAPSVLLITLEENNNDTILRIDHRSFTGKKARSHSKIFSNHWKKLIKQFQYMNKQELKRLAQG